MLLGIRMKNIWHFRRHLITDTMELAAGDDAVTENLYSLYILLYVKIKKWRGVCSKRARLGDNQRGVCDTCQD